MPKSQIYLDLERRRPVWEALSDMYLDTDVTLSRAWRIKLLAESGYSIEELEKILITEVHPVCWPNLLSVAGEWAGFNSAWLESRILAHMQSSNPIKSALNVGKLTVPRSNEWKATKFGIQAARANKTSCEKA